MKDSIVMGSNLNDHVGRDADGYGGVHGGMGFGTRNVEGERFGDAVGIVMCNIFFNKEDNKLITYQSGDNRSMIGHLMVRKIYNHMNIYIYIYILSVYSLFSDRVGLPLHNIHIPSLFTSIMDIFFDNLKFSHIRFYTL